ncbi:MAG: AAA family ATPase [Sphingomonas sp.]|jgi:hypothetical protein
MSNESRHPGEGAAAGNGYSDNSVPSQSLNKAQAIARFDNIPAELKTHPNWLCWKYVYQFGDKPKKVPFNPTTGLQANHSNPETWSSFNDAVVAYRDKGYDGIGRVFSDDDPYAGIDLDDTGGDEWLQAKHEEIFAAFDSYAERSPSGTGLHIIVKGGVPSGRKRHQVEVYSSQRYFTFTGDTFRAAPIADHSSLLNTLWTELAPERDATPDNGFNSPQVESDDVVRQRMFAAKNGEKAHDLWSGDWQKHYSSQSEADFALVNIVAFYTDNREQCARVFNASALGARNKQTSVGGVPYVEHMVAKAFSEKLPRLDHSAVINQLQALTTAERKPGRFNIMTGAELRAILPSSDAIKGILPGEGLVVGYGPSSSAKTFLFKDMGAHIAEGREWWGRRTKQRRVLYLALEGAAGFRKRVAAWATANGRDLPSDMGVAFDPFDLTNPADVAALAAECPPGVVVFIDTLNRASGNADENSPLGMGQMIAGASALQRLTNGLVVLVAHPGKDPTRGLRGHNSLFAACDAVIFVNREGDRRSWKLEKSKDGEDGIEHGFKLRIVDLGEDEDGDPITSCVVVPDDAAIPQWTFKPLSPNKHLGMASFHEAAGEHGIVDDDGNFIGIHVDAWRPVFYRSSTSDNEDTKRKAFNRARSDLVRDGQLVMENDRYRMGGMNAVAQNGAIAAALKAKRDSGTTAGHSRDSPDASSGTGRDTTL